MTICQVRTEESVGDSLDLTEPELQALADAAAIELEGAPAEEIMCWAFERFGPSLAVTSSMTDTVMVHLAEKTAPGMDVIFLDTGYHFVETIGTRDAVTDMFNVNVINVTPELSVAEQDALYGKDLFARDPDLCCHMRKVEPLGKALLPYQAWATGVRRADSASRARTKVVSYDTKKKMIKVAPIAAWTDEQVESYIEDNNLIVNPLLADGYPSIGCEPCTSRPTGDDPRSGRWAGLGKVECGIQL
jgi:phosphoadenosine phosphosulfate reductase